MKCERMEEVLARARRACPEHFRSMRLRARLLNPIQLESACPETGTVVDLACGFGLLATYVALARPRCTVVGVDHDSARLDVARALAAGLPNVSFQAADILDFEPPAAAAIYIVDSLHYFEPGQQDLMLERAWRSLEGGGRLVVRDVLRQFRPAYWWTALHERIATGPLSFTKTRGGGLHFRSRREWDSALRRFSDPPPAPRRCHAWLPYNDVLWVLEK